MGPRRVNGPRPPAARLAGLPAGAPEYYQERVVGWVAKTGADRGFHSKGRSS